MAIGSGSRKGVGTVERFHAGLTALVVVLVAAGAVRLGLQNRPFLAEHPMNLVWIGGGIVAGLAVFGVAAPPGGWRAGVPWLGWGILAAYLGFAVQGGVNGSILRRLGSTPDLWGYAALGIGAAGSQTFAKWLVLRFLQKVGALESPSRAITTGLAVGLGFGLAEIVVLGENQIVRSSGILVFPWLGIWERAAAVGLHVFSGAALAIGLHEGRWMPLVVVLALHSLDDTVAGAVSGGILHVSALVTCVFFTLVTGVLWSYYATLRRLALGGLPIEEAT